MSYGNYKITRVYGNDMIAGMFDGNLKIAKVSDGEKY